MLQPTPRRLVLPLLSLLLITSCTPDADDVPSIFPNAPVIVISVDTLRADHLPMYGYGAIETPHLDALRRDAILYSNAVAQVPLTLPSHSTLFTGVGPVRHGVRDNLGYDLDTGAYPTLPQLLRPLGYASGAAVSSYVLRADTGLGPAFDDYDDKIEASGTEISADYLERPGGKTLELAQAWIEDHLDANSTAPFFYFVHLFEPHDPYEPPASVRGRYQHPYDGEIVHVDDLLGAFFEFLRASGIYERALIVFTSDHGEGLGEHGENQHGLLLYRPTLHVPLLVKLPGDAGEAPHSGATVVQPVGLYDVAPTVLEAVGAAVPDGLDGQDLLSPSLLDGAVPGAAATSNEARATIEPSGRHIYSETYYGRLHYGWSHLRGLTGARYAYIESPNPELFDLFEDPGQQRNILADERRVYFALREQLATYDATLNTPEAADPEDAARLAALGYLTAPATTGDGPLPDPKENLHVLTRVQEAIELRTAGRHEEAVEVLRALIAEQPQIQDAHLLLVPALRALRRYDEAVAAAREARRVLPSLGPMIGRDIVQLHLLRGDVDAAAAELAALRATPGSETDVPALLLQAEIQRRRGQGSELLATLQQAHAQITAGQHSPVPGLNLERGDLLARAQRFDEAIAAFEAEITNFPAQLKAYELLAVLYATTRRFDAIEPLLERMVAANPSRESYLFAAQVLQRLGNAEGATRWRQSAMASESEGAAQPQTTP